MARYRATRMGWAHTLLKPGDEFDYDGPKGSWMELVTAPAPPNPAAPVETTTFSHMTKAAAEQDRQSFQRYTGERPVKKQK